KQCNLVFLLQHHLAHYLPNPQELLNVLLRLSASPQSRVHWQQTFWQTAERERVAARERARQNTELIVRIAAQKEACPSTWLAADGHASSLHLSRSLTACFTGLHRVSSAVPYTPWSLTPCTCTLYVA